MHSVRVYNISQGLLLILLKGVQLVLWFMILKVNQPTEKYINKLTPISDERHGASD